MQDGSIEMMALFSSAIAARLDTTNTGMAWTLEPELLYFKAMLHCGGTRGTA